MLQSNHHCIRRRDLEHIGQLPTHYHFAGRSGSTKNKHDDNNFPGISNNNHIFRFRDGLMRALGRRFSPKYRSSMFSDLNKSDICKGQHNPELPTDGLLAGIFARPHLLLAMYIM